jgi:dTDP-glucose pyrophosphorylase
MMNHFFEKHLVNLNSPLKDCLLKLNQLGADAILFILDDNQKLIGSLTDGDVRRGILKGLNINDRVEIFIQKNPKSIKSGDYDIHKIVELRNDGYKVIPIINQDGIIEKIINFRFLKSYLPIDVVVMAGGRGERLRPLTDDCPKPLLKVGEKSIIEHNIDRLISFGVDSIWISIKYLGEQIINKIGDGSKQNVKIIYIMEENPLGTIGAVSLINNFEHDHVLVTNSDILTNLDYEHFFIEFLKSDADFGVVTIPYKINIPYAVLETNDHQVLNFKEKPTYTYYSNGGIYIFKKSIVNKIPANLFFNATDLMQQLLEENKKVFSYSFAGYWLDIGKHDDFIKAQEDIKNILF